MEIVFSGICCWVDASFPGGKTVIIRNALNGGIHDNAPIPPHYAFIHAKRDQVGDYRWPADWVSADGDALYWLTGDRLTLDPNPSGGSIDISPLPHVSGGLQCTGICEAADEIRPGFIDEPTTAKVLGLMDLPATADVQCDANERGAAYAVLRMPSAPVTITATPFDDSLGQTRSLTIHDADARVFIVNVNMPEYMAGLPARDDEHKYLVCEIFRSRASEHEIPQPLSPFAAFAELAEKLPAELPQLSDIKNARMEAAAGRNMYDFLDTLAGGCSASQWP